MDLHVSHIGTIHVTPIATFVIVSLVLILMFRRRRR